MTFVATLMSPFMLIGGLGTALFSAGLATLLAKYLGRVPRWLAIAFSALVAVPMSVAAMTLVILWPSTAGFDQHFFWALGQQVEFLIFLTIGLVVARAVYGKINPRELAPENSATFR